MSLIRKVMLDIMRRRAPVISHEIPRLVHARAVESGDLNRNEALELGWVKNGLQKQKDQA